MRAETKHDKDELRPEYDFDYPKAVRGKYYKRLLKEGSNVVVLEPDVAKAFPDSTAVNEALRSLLDSGNSAGREESVFNQVFIDPEVHTLVWPNGADFDPATLHDWPEHVDRLKALARRWALTTQ